MCRWKPREVGSEPLGGRWGSGLSGPWDQRGCLAVLASGSAVSLCFLASDGK